MGTKAQELSSDLGLPLPAAQPRCFGAQCPLNAPSDRGASGAAWQHRGWWQAGCGVIAVPAAPTGPPGEHPALRELWGGLCLSLLHRRCPRFCWRQRGGEGLEKAMKSPWKVPPGRTLLCSDRHNPHPPVPLSPVSFPSPGGSPCPGSAHPLPTPVLGGQQSLSSVFGAA